jgi:nucleotide-binding universal stress UspA family protein
MNDDGPLLLPLDGSKVAERAIPFAVTVAKRLEARLVLLTALGGIATELRAHVPAAAAATEHMVRDHVARYLDSLSSRIGTGDIAVEFRVRDGDPVDEILSAVDEFKPAFVVMTTHGRSGLSRWRYGSTAGHLLHNTSVPLLVVGPNVEQPATDRAVTFKHVMIPLDGSPLAEQALPLARRIAQVFGARVSLVRVVDWVAVSFPYNLPEDPEKYAFYPQLDAIWEEAAKAYLERQKAEFKDIAIETAVVRGDAAGNLLEFVRQQAVDLVVMTTHARAGIARAALGSIADRMLQATTPVLLVRPEG